MKTVKTRYKIEFRELYYSSGCAQTTSAKFTLSIAVNKGGLAKKLFLACDDAKREKWRTTKPFLKHAS